MAIRALAALPSELRRQTRLLAVGNGDREAYAALARREGVSDSVFLRPHERETRGFYQAADAFVLPSFYEPFGLVALEAAACACPPVLSACTGAAELFTPGQSALTVENPGDTAGFTRALTDLLVDPARAQAMGLQARAVALRRGWDQVVRDYRARLMELG